MWDQYIGNGDALHTAHSRRDRESDHGPPIHRRLESLIITTFAAVVGASSLPGVGRSATPWQESTIGFGPVGMAMLVYRF
jgi:hypothetical protein